MEKALSEKYFKDSEFVCKCGKCGMGIADINYKALGKLAVARDIAGIPFKLVSAVRCPTHNKAVGGEKNSAHMRGYAFDVAAPTSSQRMTIVKAAIAAGFPRIGVYSTFVHMDCDPDLPQGVMWHGK